MEREELKRKLRNLKKVEKRIRFSIYEPSNPDYIWSRFFSTKENYYEVCYPFPILLGFSKELLTEVIQEYFYNVYFKYYSENGLNAYNAYDPQLLSLLGLEPGADIDRIKKRFRELAKKYHPDKGGDSDKMIELLDIYNKLTGN